MPSYLAAQAPRPSLLYLPNLNPPTLLFSLLQDRLLFLAPVSSDIEPLLVIEFLHRVADALEEFLGSPLLASKIEANYDVVAQIAGEMCDAGSVCNTEPNALREVVEVPNWLGSLLGGLELPGYGGFQYNNVLQELISLLGQLEEVPHLQASNGQHRPSQVE